MKNYRSDKDELTNTYQHKNSVITVNKRVLKLLYKVGNIEKHEYKFIKNGGTLVTPDKNIIRLIKRGEE